jgi:hemerythrin-like domain-containing protein
MSKAKSHDSALVNQMLTDAVAWFNEARRHPDNQDRELFELARECANGTFKNHMVAIPVARREIVARKFMDACRERFAYEVPKAAAEVKEPELELVS